MKRKILGMMGKMEVHLREEGDIGIIELAGEIDIYNCGEIRKIIEAYRDRKVTKIIVDMGKVTYIDSSTIGVLLSEHKRLREEKGDLKIMNLKGVPRDVFNMARLESFFDIYDDEKAAIQAFGSS